MVGAMAPGSRASLGLIRDGEPVDVGDDGEIADLLHAGESVGRIVGENATLSHSAPGPSRPGSGRTGGADAGPSLSAR